jgi:hypothetical protein
MQFGRFKRFRSGSLLGVALLAVTALLAQTHDDIALRAMKDELARSMTQLQLPQMDKPYFLAYRIQDIEQQEISATLGSLTSGDGTAFRNRMISVELRVGDYTVDNSNFFSMQRLRGGSAGMFMGGVEQGSVDDDYGQIRRQLWIVSDRQYKRALEDLSAKRAALKMRNGGEPVPDFSKEIPLTLVQARTILISSSTQLQSLAKDLSAVFRSAPEIERSSVTITRRDVFTRYVNSEGTTFTRWEPLIKLEVSARTQAGDGLPISNSFTVYGRTVPDLPPKETLLAHAQRLSSLIVKLRSAATLDRYNGPVLFEGSAAGELFLQQFGTKLAASRAPMSDNPQFEVFFNQMLERLGGSSFQEKLGARVLPAFLSVRDDPQETAFKGATLLGASSIDDDGVKTRATVLVDHGTLKTLLTSRTPVRGLLQSSGSRRGFGAVASNLFVESQKAMSDGDLHKELLGLAKDRGLDYAIIVRHVGSGSAASFMDIAKQMANHGGAADSLPEVFKLYPDGHEEALRGVHIGELPAEAFKEIVATGETPVLYNDEIIPRISSIFSGGITSAGETLPVASCIAPSLLFEEVSLAKTQGPFPALPVSPSPLAEK